jgi:sulfate adenylyltransferase subunit 1 (EFTu-like GTPase family)
MPVSDIYRFDHRRIIAGRVEAGVLHDDDEIPF